MKVSLGQTTKQNFHVTDICHAKPVFFTDWKKYKQKLKM